MWGSEDDTVTIHDERLPSGLGDLPAADINGRYRVVEVLGRGGMGVVYRAFDRVREMDVALKMLHRETRGRLSGALLAGEFETLAAFQHPNVARVHDFARCQETGDTFFTMELVKGHSALDATSGAERNQVWDIALQVLRALAYLHTRDVIHLDVKPANILVTLSGKVKVVDFGIARSTHATYRGRFATLPYVAPELVREDGEFDRRADLYSFGVTLCQLLFRRLPDPPALLTFGTTSPASPGALGLLAEQIDGVSSWVWEVLRRLVASNPGERFRTASEAILAINSGLGRHEEIETEETRKSYLASAALVSCDSVMNRTLDRIHARMKRGRGGPLAVFLSGSSGTGKSRLLRVLRQRCQLARYHCFDGESYGDRPESFAAWRGVVRQAIPLIQASIKTHGRVIDTLAPSMARQAELSQGERPLDLHELGKGVLKLLLDTGAPLVVTVADLHLMDAGSLELLEVLLECAAHEESQGAVRVIILGTLREGESQAATQVVRRLTSAGLAEELALYPLDPSNVEALVHSMLGSTDLKPSLCQALTQATGGNALLIVETLRAWANDGSIRPEPSGWSFRQNPTASEIGEQLSDLLANRLGKLAPLQREVVEALSVSGRPLPFGTLERMLSIDRDTVLRVATELQRERLTFASQDERVHLAASVWGDVARRAMARSARAGWHRRLAASLDPEDDPALVAWHWERGDEPSEAARWYAKAAGGAFRRGDLGSTVRHTQEAARLGAVGPDFGSACSLAADAALRLGLLQLATQFGKTALRLVEPATPDWNRASRVVIASFTPGGS